MPEPGPEKLKGVEEDIKPRYLGTRFLTRPFELWTPDRITLTGITPKGDDELVQNLRECLE